MRLSPTFLLVVLLLLVLVTGGAAVGAYSLARQFVAEAPIELPPLPNLGGGAGPTAAPLLVADVPTVIPPTVASTTALGATLAATQPQIASPTNAPAFPASLTRVNVLILGIDQRKGETRDFKTDTIMVLSLDPVRKTGVLLSIPRDIYMQIPKYQIRNRINTAYSTGELNAYPGGGAWVTALAVQSIIGVKIHHYVVVNFDVFTAVIDAVGPVQVCPDKPIHDDHYPDGSYGFITVDFKPGCQELASEKLLQYARVRHNADEDFGRSRRQQEVIKAVQQKVLSLGGMSALLGKIGPVWDAVKTSVKTDMTFDQMVELAQIGQKIPRENIQSAVLTTTENYVLPAKTAQGEDVLTPNFEKIHDLIEALFDAKPGSAPVQGSAVPAPPTQAVSLQTAPATAAPASDAAFVALPPTLAPTATDSDDGKAAIQTLNGSGVDGYGKLTVDKLRAQGFNALDAKTADLKVSVYAVSVIKVYNNKMKTARALAAAMGLDGSVIQPTSNPPPGVDIEFFIGTDIAKKK